MPDKKQVNKGPTGGEYDNDTNVISDSGETQENEATNATGKTMSYNEHTEDSSHDGESRQADEGEVRGGQASSS